MNDENADGPEAKPARTAWLLLTVALVAIALAGWIGLAGFSRKASITFLTPGKGPSSFSFANVKF